jgi:hypothetical protein
MGHRLSSKMTKCVALLAFCIGCASATRTEHENLEKCRNTLRSLSYAILDYRSEHSERFPPSLFKALENQGVSESAIRKLQRCPAGGDYIYINWPKFFTGDIPKDYPLIFDAQNKQHGKGINIVRVDGTVFFDANMAWLSEFLRSHPEVKIPVPK